jgi:hypothetical protein
MKMKLLKLNSVLSQNKNLIIKRNIQNPCNIGNNVKSEEKNKSENNLNEKKKKAVLLAVVIYSKAKKIK